MDGNPRPRASEPIEPALGCIVLDVIAANDVSFILSLKEWGPLCQPAVRLCGKVGVQKRGLIEFAGRMWKNRVKFIYPWTIGGNVPDPFSREIHPRARFLPVASAGGASELVYKRGKSLPVDLGKELTYRTLFLTTAVEIVRRV